MFKFSYVVCDDTKYANAACMVSDLSFQEGQINTQIMKYEHMSRSSTLANWSYFSLEPQILHHKHICKHDKLIFYLHHHLDGDQLYSINHFFCHRGFLT